MDQEHICACDRSRTGVIQKLHNIRQWMGQDSDNLVFRRFDDLSVRNLLFLQHQLSDVERKIEGLDYNRIEDDIPTYDALLLQARTLLSSYHDAFFAYQRMKSVPHTPAYMLSVLENPESFTSQALKKEHDGPSGYADLSSIVVTQKGVIHRYIDSNWRLTSLLARIENRNEKASPSSPSSMYNYSEKVLWYIDQFVVNCCVVSLVAIPVVLLTFVPTMLGRLCVVLGFTVLAAPVTSVVSAKYLAGTNMPLMLGYTAILVAFLSQTSDSTRKS